MEQINKEKANLLNWINEYRFKEVLTQIEAMCVNSTNWELLTDIQETQRMYEAMMGFFRLGVKDPTFSNQYAQLKRKVYELTQHTFYMLQYEKGKSYKDSYTRNLRKYPSATPLEVAAKMKDARHTIATLCLLNADKSTPQVKRQYRIIQELRDSQFIHLWTCDMWSNADLNEAEALFNHQDINENDKCCWTSALMLNLLDFFDARKFLFLCNLYHHASWQLQVRIVTALVFTTLKYHSLFALYPECENELTYLTESNEVQEGIRHILHFCFMVQNLNATSDFMSTIIKPNAKGILNKDDLTDEDDKLEIIESIQDGLLKWKKLGADLQHNSFTYFKKFSYFDHIAHWFYLFDETEISCYQDKTITAERKFANTILQSDALCNSDKYSFELMFNMVSDNKSNNLMGLDINSFVEMFKVEVNPESLNHSDNKTMYQNYIQDLTRFYLLFNYHLEFSNPLYFSADNWASSPLFAAINQPKFLYFMGGLAIKVKQKEAAALFFNNLLKIVKQPDEKILRGAGMAYELAERYTEALDCYLKADLLNPDNPLIYKRMAHIYEKQQDFRKASLYYDHLLDIESNNTDAIMDAATCLFKQGKSEESLNLFFKLYYLEESVRSTRGIAHCYYMMHKAEKAIEYYSKGIDHEETEMRDYLMLGHCHLSTGNRQAALDAYAKAYSKSQSHEEFLSFYKDTVPHTLSLTPEEINLIPDLLL